MLSPLLLCRAPPATCPAGCSSHAPSPTNEIKGGAQSGSLPEALWWPFLRRASTEDSEPTISLQDTDTDELASDEDTIDTANKWAKTKSQFKPGNPYRFTKNDESEDKTFDLDSIQD